MFPPEHSVVCLRLAASNSTSGSFAKLWLNWKRTQSQMCWQTFPSQLEKNPVWFFYLPLNSEKSQCCWLAGHPFPEAVGMTFAVQDRWCILNSWLPFSLRTWRGCTTVRFKEKFSQNSQQEREIYWRCLLPKLESIEKEMTEEAGKRARTMSLPMSGEKWKEEYAYTVCKLTSDENGLPWDTGGVACSFQCCGVFYDAPCMRSYYYLNIRWTRGHETSAAHAKSGWLFFWRFYWQKSCKKRPQHQWSAITFLRSGPWSAYQIWFKWTDMDYRKDAWKRVESSLVLHTWTGLYDEGYVWWSSDFPGVWPSPIIWFFHILLQTLDISLWDAKSLSVIRFSWKRTLRKYPSEI